MPAHVFVGLSHQHVLGREAVEIQKGLVDPYKAAFRILPEHAVLGGIQDSGHEDVLDLVFSVAVMVVCNVDGAGIDQSAAVLQSDPLHISVEPFVAAGAGQPDPEGIDHARVSDKLHQLAPHGGDVVRIKEVI